MALKDWKKSGVNEWRKNGMLLRMYVSRESYHYSSMPAWVVIVKHERSNNYFEDRVFPNKTKALIFAKSYMRSH